MAEPAVLWPDSSGTPTAPAPTAAPPPPAEGLEQRVERLETTVAAIQDTQALEDRITERVSERLQHKVSAEVERVSAERRLSTVSMMSAADKALRAVAPLAAPAVAGRAPWLLLDLVLEATTIGRMFFDFSYKIGWPTRVLVLVLLAAIFTSQLWVPASNLWLVGEVLDKLVDLVLAFVLIKILSREAQRYQQSRPT
jgi:hypothetical protein